jgi:hypothetical protein
MAQLDDRIRARRSQWCRFLGTAGADAPELMFLVRCGQDEPQRPPLWPELAPQRVEWAWQHYQWQRRRAEWLPDDTVPCLQVATGTEIFAEAFGCPVRRPPDQMPFAQPAIHAAGQVASLAVPDLANSSLAYLFGMADQLRERAGPEALLRLVDIQAPMDIAALIWDKSDFLAAMITAPEAVCELSAKVQQLLTAFLDEWFARYGRHFVAHYPDYYMDAGVTVSVDEAGAVSPAMFARFFGEQLRSLSQRYGGIGIHCCANARHQWPHFARVPGLRLINLHQPHAVLAEAYAAFGPQVAQLHYGFEHTGPVETWPAQHPPGRRVVYDITAKTAAEAQELAARLEEARLAG